MLRSMARPVRILAATYDISGNLYPLLGLIEALVAAGHRVTCFAHRTQQLALKTVGASVCSYTSAFEVDAGSTVGRLRGLTPFREFDRLAAADVRAAVDRFSPDVLLIDCLMPMALTDARARGRPVVALIHGAFHVFRTYTDGLFREPMEGADLPLVCSYRAFHEGDVPPRMVWVGPLRPTPAPRSWKRECSDRPLVLASLSTGYQDQEQTLRNVCAALSECPVEALVTVGRGFNPADIRAGANVSVVRAVPHEHVLADADLLITHAGHGTTMMGLRFGVPLLCLPGIGDQPANADRVVALGLGEKLDPASSVKLIRAATARLLADAEMRKRAQAFARDVRDHPGADFAVAQIEALAARREVEHSR
jgi:UDP:flavonoid glycosyltransferase YjiC (YdhE family)